MTQSYFTLDGQPEHTWTAHECGEPWNGWATPVVDRDTLQDVIATDTRLTLRFTDAGGAIIYDTTTDDFDTITPTPTGHYSLRILGWRFQQLPDPDKNASPYDDTDSCIYCGQHLADPHGPECPISEIE